MISQKFIEKHLYQRSLLSYLLYPLSLIFTAVQKIRRMIYSSIPGLSYRSPCHIISVGNIVSGGSGKTPLTIFLAQYLSQKGRKIAVSHRDYGGRFERENRLISDRKEVFSEAKYAGDEAYLLARKLPGIPVIAGKHRKRSIEKLVQEFPDLDHIILDDSFQHLKVKHDLDIIVMNALGGRGNGFLLPAGILREPVSVLAKADLIVLNNSIDIPDYLSKYKEKLIAGKYRTKGFFDLQNIEKKITDFKGKRIALFSGIGNPAAFELTVKEVGISFVHHFKFADHHHYDRADLEKLRLEADLKDIDLFITTEKDQVKLTKLEVTDLDIIVLKIELTLDNLDEAAGFIIFIPEENL